VVFGLAWFLRVWSMIVLLQSCILPTLKLYFSVTIVLEFIIF